MEHENATIYLSHNHNLWDVIVNGDLEKEAAPSGEQSAPLAPKTAKQLAAKRNQERVKSILLLALLDEYLLKFHNVPNAKSLYATIKSRFGVSKEDINQKFLRSIPPSWSQIALIMRNKPDIDQVAMLTVRVQRFVKKTIRNLDFKGKQPVTFDKSKVECFNYQRKGNFAKNANQARLEIQGYELALESLESRILGHEKNELAWGEKYEFQNYELKCRELKIDNLKMELEKVVKEKDELKVKIEKWEESSKGLNKLLNSQMSAKDKNGLGYGTQLDEISNKSETDNLDEYAIRKIIIESITTEPEANTSKSKTSETIDDEDDVSEVNTVSPVKTNKIQIVKTQVD
ncbi:hypothetical protein Tco_0710460 [Tanacetum coccineum]